MTLPAVAVFEAGLPPAMGFIRSLGRAGVRIRAFDSLRHVPGRYSKYVDRFDLAPNVHDVDDFVAWLEEFNERERINLIPPTSDFTAFAVAEFDERHGTDLAGGIGGAGGAQAVRDCLFKDRFARRMEEIGFPVPEWAAPTSLDEAVRAADSIGYPIVLKPRSHIGIGVSRGQVVHDVDELRAAFGPYPIGRSQTMALRHDPDLDWPLMQHMVTGDHIEVMSISGHVDTDGRVEALERSRKTSQWGGELGIGTMFEVVDHPRFIGHVLEAIPRLLRAAIFEFEVLVDVDTGRYWAIELNPRGFGQMSLSIARGSDLPVEWYRSATGIDLASAHPPRRPPRHWRMGTPYFVGTAVRAIRGPDRRATIAELARSVARPTAAAMHSWSDPRPGLAFIAHTIRHPGGLVRPFLDG